MNLLSYNMVIDKKRLIEIIEDFVNKNVAVIGDFCLDEYILGKANSLSPEAPVPRVIIDSKTYIPGAAGNVASSIRALGATTAAFGVIGNDISGKILVQELGKRDVNTSGMVIVERYTPTYSRIVAGRQQLVRFDLENENEIDQKLIEKIFQKMETVIKDSDAVIFADYDEIGHGLARPNLIENLAQSSIKYNKILAGISRKRLYHLRNFTLLVPNEREACQSAGLELKTEEYTEAVGRALVQGLNSNVAITRGEKGVVVFAKNGKATHNLPSFAKKVVDVTGAGDVLTSAMVLSLSSGASLYEAAHIGSYAAAVAVGKEGTATVTTKEIMELANGK